MKNVFVDTSGFYALLDTADPAHERVTNAFLQAEAENWHLITTNYVVQESWALIRKRLGWDALEAFLDAILPLCEIEFVAEPLHALGATRCRHARQRHLSLTDCISFELIRQRRLSLAISTDEHFSKEGLLFPTLQR